MTVDFGKWQIPWGEVNRFQRVTGDIVQPFDDSKPSIPVPFTSGRWGSLAAFEAKPTDRASDLADLLLRMGPGIGGARLEKAC